MPTNGGDRRLAAAPAAASLDELYERMMGTLVASWERYAEGAPQAALHAVDDAVVAVFPEPPERAVFNNAILARNLDAARAALALATVERVYKEASVTRYAMWVHETESAAIALLDEWGYHVDTWTRAMAMSLDEIPVGRPELDLGPPDWHEYLRIVGVPDGVLSGVDPSGFHVRVARRDNANVATAMACDHEGDCGIYNVVTVPEARRQGLGTALTALHLYEARARGCATASLQATEMAERVYAGVGFRDLGRILEYVR